VQAEGEESCPAANYFARVHEILGIDWLSVYRQVQMLTKGPTK
jgi:hypothetical protein